MSVTSTDKTSPGGSIIATSSMAGVVGTSLGHLVLTVKAFGNFLVFYCD